MLEPPVGMSTENKHKLAKKTEGDARGKAGQNTQNIASRGRMKG